ncbi:MAG: hypothetical protein LAT67_09740 [Balneolales bacterium]|nr:hypothetical protein [Balneolales bacterium]
MKQLIPSMKSFTAYLTVAVGLLLFASSGIQAQSINAERERQSNEREQLEAYPVSDMIQIRSTGQDIPVSLFSDKSGSLSESFEGATFPPTGWTRFPVSGG